jgi:hypothetical protein
MKSHRHPDFLKSYAKLPKEVRAQARKAYQLFRVDPYHTSLHFKKIHPTRAIYSVRVGISYRAVGFKQGDVMIWYWIGHHSEYDNLFP